MADKELVIKVVAMPCDTNPDGDMFGGWILSQMDLAAYLHARKLSSTKIVTVAIDNIVFHRPVLIGDCLICYAVVEKMGRTSVTIKIEAMVERKQSHMQEKVTEGRFTFVAIDGDRKPTPIQMPQ
jgi:acyl-CoA thioesterase YciA